MKAKEPLACIIGSIILTIVVMIIAFIAKDSFASWEGIGSGWFGFVITMFLLFVSSYISRLVLLPMYRRDPIIFIVGGIVVTAGGIFILLLIAYLIVLFSEWIYYSYINKEMGKRISKMRTELSAELITENE
jgi:membrane protease YdiL (CAAX protease family)